LGTKLFKEDLDDDDDLLKVKIDGLLAGTYKVNMGIYDGKSLIIDDSCCDVTVTPPDKNKDSDGDGVPDYQDNCRYASNPLQKDSGNVVSTLADGIGDACQCGDLDGDGVVTQADGDLLLEALKPSSAVVVPELQKCQVVGTPACDKQDANTILAHVLKADPKKVNPPLPDLCVATKP
ncbi:thrombospondin type 3 repeat-containing protein, partial [Oligoflexia bacterium]|nr:thrombospondin type 3 repeat-containing protein [Oligoflexia bacterium]